MKKILTKIKESLMRSTTKVRWMLLTKTERKMMGISTMITEEYIRSRTFRRELNGTTMGDMIKDTLKNW
jgi:hypothetical protein